MNKPNKIIVHHTGGTDVNPLADTSHHTFEMIRDWHVKGNKWSDIGYNWVIEKTGKKCKGRDENLSGAHTIGHNSNSVGICLSGNFDATMPTPEQVQSMCELIEDIIKRYPNITPDQIFPHRKFANKTCYGKNLSDTWASDEYKKYLSKKGTTQNVPVKTLSSYSTDEILAELKSRCK